MKEAKSLRFTQKKNKSNRINFSYLVIRIKFWTRPLLSRLDDSFWPYLNNKNTYLNSAKNSTLEKVSFRFVGHWPTLGLLAYKWPILPMCQFLISLFVEYYADFKNKLFCCPKVRIWKNYLYQDNGQNDLKNFFTIFRFM
jgi:hypothetical protein